MNKIKRETIAAAAQVESGMEYDKWFDQIPYFDIPKGWKFKPVPPFAGAVARFRVLAEGKEFSIYLDCYDRLGCVGAPYWEVYEIDGDVMRFDIKDSSGLIDCIKNELERIGSAPL